DRVTTGWSKLGRFGYALACFIFRFLRRPLVVDLQNEYLPTGQLPLVGLQEVVANAARIIAAARERGDLIVHC
ncbi:hypothetical protein OII53_21060, partial [Achromobacter ruhlandii]|nr:hypothetical protein [Achromobacter ruhlandii]MCV6804689.1 hypothetical protein [Achromobacter ruhlandii]MCV6821043.1 hypothetical protein [Achromobacter ruhlandii]